MFLGYTDHNIFVFFTPHNMRFEVLYHVPECMIHDKHLPLKENPETNVLKFVAAQGWKI